MKLPSPRFTQSRRPASKERGRMFLVGLGAIGVAAAITLLTIGYLSPKGIPLRSYYNLKAQFTNADNLTSSYQVRIGGRLVGQVLDPKVENGKAVVKLQLNPSIKPLLSDTTLRVRPRSPVGVRFVELTPGTKGHPLAEGDEIPASQTSSTVQLDEVLGTLDADHRAKAKTLISELGNGFVGRGEDLNEAIGAAPGTLKNLDSVATALNQRTGSIENFVAGSESAASAADPVRTQIGKGFEPEGRALQPFAQEGAAIRRLLTTAPADLTQVRAGLSQTDPLLGSVTKLARAATPAFASARTALDETSGLLREAPPGLVALRKTLDLAGRAVNPTLLLTRTLNPVLPIVDDTLTSSLPILGQLGPRDCDLRRFFDNWTGTLAYGDGFSNVLRFDVISSLESLQGYTDKTAKYVPGMFNSAYPGPCAVDSQKTTNGGQG